MMLSVVATLYRSEPHLVEFHQRASAAASRLAGDDYEIVLVNDGSPDGSLDLALRLAEADPHLVVVDLSRNFGHHKAMMTGLAHAVGDLVFLIDSDLEEEPEWLEAFATRLASEKCDVIFGVQERRKGGWFERWSGQAFYRSFRLLSGVDLPDNLVTARLMTRRYVDALVLHGEQEIVIAGLWAITGFDQRKHIVKKHSKSETTYSLWKKISICVNAITSFSSLPLSFMFYVGAFVFLISIIVAFVFMLHWLFMSRPISGWTSLIVSIWLLGGIVISFIGIVGMYVGKIFSEVKDRPYTIVRRIYRREKNDD
ncbi:putative glycosyltransferases [mine drainage metagenome]|uniref:Putative glycosyltransferases n=1 Tax=mine drainage metagenome TaxID=410659 RepID=A0A1J5R9J3_9ZZZZ